MVGSSSMVLGAGVRIVGLIKRTPIFDWYMGSFVLKNGQPNKEDYVINSHISYSANKITSVLNSKVDVVFFRYFPLYTHFSCN